MPFSHSGTSRTFACNDANTSVFHYQARPSRPCPHIGGKITKESAVNDKEIDTNGVNRMLLRRPWRTDQKNRFLDKVWTPQFSTTPPKPFLLSFSTHLGDQTLARSIWKRSQLLDAFFRLAQGLNKLGSSCSTSSCWVSLPHCSKSWMQTRVFWKKSQGKKKRTHQMSSVVFNPTWARFPKEKSWASMRPFEGGEASAC